MGFQTGAAVSVRLRCCKRRPPKQQALVLQAAMPGSPQPKPVRTVSVTSAAFVAAAALSLQDLTQDTSFAGLKLLVHHHPYATPIPCNTWQALQA